MLKRIKSIAMAAALLCSFAAYPADAAGYLEVYLYDGSVTTLRLSDNPEITFADADVTFLGNNIDLTVPFAQIQGMKYHDGVNLSVNPARQSDSTIRVIGKSLHINNSAAAASLSVYSLSGRLLKRLAAIPEGSTVISLSDLPAGIYIVNLNNQSLTVKLHD